MKRRNKQMKKIISGVAVVALVAIIIVIGVLVMNNNKFKYNEEGATGNTTGNLQNGGLFCQYEDTIYFANPADGHTLYSMKTDGSNIKKVYNDKVSCIQIVNGYIYYIRANELSEDVVLTGTMHGIFRLKIGDRTPDIVYQGVVDDMVVCGNYIYFKSYDDENLIQFKKVKIDGKELSVVSDDDIDSLAVWKSDVYYTGIDGKHNLTYSNEGSDAIHKSSEGNYYMPSFSDGYFYYIDINNDMKLCRMSLKTNEVTVLDEGYCINYNVSSEYGVIYYQLENEDGHKLRRMDIYGTNKTTIAEGDYCDIHITKNYTYYNEYVSVDKKQLYCVETNGNIARKVDFVSADED